VASSFSFHEINSDVFEASKRFKEQMRAISKAPWCSAKTVSFVSSDDMD